MSTMRATPPLEIGWIDLDGVNNMRDLVGTPTADGGRIAPHRLIRSDNLDRLPPASIETLVNHLEVSDIIDLRTSFELTRIGSGPLRQDPRVRVTTGSLYPDDDPACAVPPWQAAPDPSAVISHVEATSQHYLDYLGGRPDTVLKDLRVIAGARGATVVHCAAGKDRTGTIIALVLSTLGAGREDIVADYAATSQRLGRILASLGRAAAAGAATQGAYSDEQQSTPPEIMERTLDLIDSRLGGVPRYLHGIGWTTTDQDRLEAHLLDE